MKSEITFGDILEDLPKDAAKLRDAILERLERVCALLNKDINEILVTEASELTSQVREKINTLASKFWIFIKRRSTDLVREDLEFLEGQVDLYRDRVKNVLKNTDGQAMEMFSAALPENLIDVVTRIPQAFVPLVEFIAGLLGVEMEQVIKRSPFILVSTAVGWVKSTAAELAASTSAELTGTPENLKREQLNSLCRALEEIKVLCTRHQAFNNPHFSILSRNILDLLENELSPGSS